MAASLGVALSSLLGVATPAPALGLDGPYLLVTAATYQVLPEAGEIAVTVTATFTNTTQDSSGQTSGFDRIDLAIHESASQLAARDARGVLSVSRATRDGVAVASVRPRARIRAGHSISFTLTYRLVNGSGPDIHVGEVVAKFPAWGFGTSSEVTVTLPGAWSARADGDPMLIDSGGSELRMTSGPIPDPTTWLALVTASQASAAHGNPVSASVALESGTVDLQVRAFAADPAWSDRTIATLVAGLPALEAAIGLPYPMVGPLDVIEVVGDAEGAPGEPGVDLRVAFDADAFTLLHQAAHLWIHDGLLADPWLREGIASHAAGVAAQALGEPLPYDPSARATDLAADAFPLDEWQGGSTVSSRSAYAYAASWAAVDRLARGAGEANIARALRRVAAGVAAYDPVDADQLPLGDGPAVPVDTRRFLDQLAAAAGVDVTELVGDAVFGPAGAEKLEQRRLARADLLRLLRAAGDWGAPEQIRSLLADWRFDEARAQIALALTWLSRRDVLFRSVDEAGLSVPDQLRQRFAAAGGGPEAVAELAAEGTVVDAYRAVQRSLAGERGPLEAIGLFAAADPAGLLTRAGADYERGDLSGAAEALDAARVELERAAANGVVRIASAVVLVTVAALLWNLAIRRRGGSHYTGAR